MKKQRKHYTPEEKVAILRRHLLEQVPISELCDKHGLQPTVFYRWQKEFFENAAAAFQPKAPVSAQAGGKTVNFRIVILEQSRQNICTAWQPHVNVYGLRVRSIGPQLRSIRAPEDSAFRTGRTAAGNHYSFAYSAFARMRIGISRSASFQSVRKSW